MTEGLARKQKEHKSMSLFSSFEVVKKKAEQAAAQSGGSFGYVGNIYWTAKGDDSKRVIRFLHTGPALRVMHEFILCSDGKKRDFVCRESVLDEPGPCPLCVGDISKREVGIGLAVLREETFEEGKGGPVAILKDLLHDVELQDGDDTVTKKLPYLGIVRQAVTNFWANLTPYAYRNNGSCTNRDYLVERLGGDKKTNYAFIPLEHVEGLKTEEELSERYKEALNGKTVEQVVTDWINWNGSKKKYQKFFGDNVFTNGVSTPEDNGNETQVTQTTQTEQKEEGSQTLTSLRDHLAKYNKKS